MAWSEAARAAAAASRKKGGHPKTTALKAAAQKANPYLQKTRMFKTVDSRLSFARTVKKMQGFGYPRMEAYRFTVRSNRRK